MPKLPETIEIFEIGDNSMFVTTQPGRIVEAGSLSIASKQTKRIGSEGLSTHLSTAGAVCLSECGCPTPANGYAAVEGEVFDFSGEITVYNPSDSAVTVSYLIYDTF